MGNILTKLKRLFTQRDARYMIYERYTLFVGIVSLGLSRVLYRSRLVVQPPYKVWGNIRFIINGPGSISIGKNFHAVSNRKRSFITLFSPCQLSISGNGKIILGDHVGLNGTTIFSRKSVTIGNDVMIAPNTIIVDHDGHAAWPPSDRWNVVGSAQEIVIEKDVWIGMNCIVLKGVHIGSGSIIAAGSVVIHDVESNCLYAGNPAKKIKRLDQ